MQYRTQTNYGSLLHSYMLTTDDTTQSHSSRPIKEVRPSPYTGVPKAGVIISPVSTDGVTNCIGYRIEIVCLISTLSTILQHFTHTMKFSDPLLLLADDTLLWGLYPRGKVAISQHLISPGSPVVTIMSAIVCIK